MPANNRRKLVRVEVSDAEKRRFPSKHYSYVIKVCWTDDSETVIYRRYSKFFEFQIILLETFPYEGGLKEPSARIIPFLPGKILFRRSHVRDVAMKRLIPIDEYCKGLVRLPPHISESDHVLDFFETRPEDLNPVREDGSRRKKRDDQGSLPRRVRSVRRTRSLDIGEISGPILLEQYVAIADYTSTQNKELTIFTGQHLEVIEKNENGWWFVSNDEGERGWVPGVYLERPDGAVEDLVTKQAEPGQGESYITIQSYTAETAEEISLGAGVTVEVLQKNLEGWWLVNYQGKQGYAPASYLEKTHDWVQQNSRRTVEIIPSIRDLKHRHSLPANNLSAIAYPSQQILKSSNVTPTAADTNFSSSAFKPSVSSYKEKAVQPPPKRSSVKKPIKKRPDGPPPLPPSATSSEPTYEYMTIAPFNANVPDGVSFSEEKHVEVLEKSPGGWWYIKIDGSEGWAPASYIERREREKAAKAAPPTRPGPPKLTKTNSAGKINVNGNSSPIHNASKINAVPQQQAKISFPASKSQCGISPATRPLPPLPTSSSASCLPDHDSETYEEVGMSVSSRKSTDDLPTRPPPLPPLHENKPQKTTELESKLKSRPLPKTTPKVEESGEVDFRSVLKSSISARQKELKASRKPSGSPPRPPTKPGAARAGLKTGSTTPKPQVNDFKAALKPVKPTADKSAGPKPNGAVPTAKSGSVKKPFKPATAPDPAEPPKLPPKPKPSFKNQTPVLRDNVQSSDDGAVVDFRSVLRSTQRKQSSGSNPVGRSKSFNSDKIVPPKFKTQQASPPSVPKKPPNLPLKPRVPNKMKGLDSSDSSENRPKPSNARPPWRSGNKPVLQRFQANNSNSNTTSEKKPVFTVGRVEIPNNPPQELAAVFMKRGSPDGQVDDIFAEKSKANEKQPSTVVPPERLKKVPKDAKRLPGLELKPTVEKLPVPEPQAEKKEVYTAVSDYEGVEECEISFKCGEEAEVLEKSEHNWWYVSIRGEAGWAPSSFFLGEDMQLPQNLQTDNVGETSVATKSDLEQSSEAALGDAEPGPPPPVGSRFPADFTVAADFVADDVSMLSLTAGDTVTVMQEASGGWWFAVAKDGSGEGWVPSTYLDPV